MGLSDGFFNDIGGAVSDLFASKGASQAAGAYGKAATIAQDNADITLRSGLIQQEQAQRSIVQTLGSEQAATAGAGFDASSGSAFDLMRSSVQQGALSKQLLANQTEITAQGFDQQAAAYQGQQQAAQTQSKGSGIGGIIGAVAGIASIFSDARMKENIVWLREDGAHNIYSYNFKGSTETREGVLAQEVMGIMPEAVETDTSGYYKVRYDMLKLKTVHYGR